MKAIHPKTTVCIFNCATCGNKFEIETTIAAKTYAIDICSKCHPFYIGKAANKHLRGTSEKLQAKFDTTKTKLTEKPTATKTKEAKVNTSRKSLDSL